MFIVVIGFIMLLAAWFVPPSAGGKQTARNLLRIVGLGVIVLGLLTMGVRQINPGQVGVQVLFGKVKSEVLNPGLHLVNPLVEIHTFDVKTLNYTMSRDHDEGEKAGDDAIRVLSADGLEVVIDLTVLFRVQANDAPRLLQEVGEDYLNVIVRPVSRTRIRDNAVYFDAISLYSTKRDEFQARIFEQIKKDFALRGLVLEGLLIRNIDLPASVKLTIESKINAEQEAQKMQFVLQKESQEAERKRVEAQGIADYQRIISLNLTDKQLQYEAIKANQAIATSPNTKVIIMGNRGASPNILLSDK